LVRREAAQKNKKVNPRREAPRIYFYLSAARSAAERFCRAQRSTGRAAGTPKINRSKWRAAGAPKTNKKIVRHGAFLYLPEDPAGHLAQCLSVRVSRKKIENPDPTFEKKALRAHGLVGYFCVVWFGMVGLNRNQALRANVSVVLHKMVRRFQQNKLRRHVVPATFEMNRTSAKCT